MFLGTDASTALLQHLAQRDPGQWVGNVTFNGEFGRSRPDLIYIGPRALRLHLFEIKAIGSDDLAKRDVSIYLSSSTIRSPLVAGDTDLIFRGDSALVVDAIWFGGRTKYTFYPASIRARSSIRSIANQTLLAKRPM